MSADDVKSAVERLTKIAFDNDVHYGSDRLGWMVGDVPTADLRTILARLDQLTEENERLRLLILGGEDVSGVAASLAFEEVERLHKDAVSRHQEDIDTILAMEAALTSDEEPDEYAPTPRQRALDYAVWATATYKSYREWLERATKAEAEIARLTQLLADSDEARNILTQAVLDRCKERDECRTGLESAAWRIRYVAKLDRKTGDGVAATGLDEIAKDIDTLLARSAQGGLHG